MSTPSFNVDTRNGLVMLFAFSIAAAFLLFGDTLAFGPFGDDLTVVQRAQYGQRLAAADFFRPLSDRSIEAGHALFGTSAAGQRAFNILVHGLCAAFLVLLVSRLPGRFPTWTAFAAGALFLCYPYHGEAVIWIVGRGASMATLFTLIALYALCTRITMWQRAAISAAALFLGALAYESALLIPVLACTLSYALRYTRRERGLLVGVWAATVLAYLTVRSFYTENVVNAYGTDLFQHSVAHLLLNVPKTLGRLVLPPMTDPRLPMILFVVLVLVVVLLARRLKSAVCNDPDGKRSLIVLAIMLLSACSLAFLASVSTRTSESDRFLYMPSAFLCAVVPLAISRTTDQRRGLISVGLLLVLSGIGLWQNKANWRIASGILDQVPAMIPTVHPGQRLLVHDLPGDTAGAFILRNGFPALMLLHERDTTGMVQIVRTNIGPQGDTLYLAHGGDSLRPLPQDIHFRYPAR